MVWNGTFYQPTLEWKPFFDVAMMWESLYYFLSYLLQWLHAIYFALLPSTVHLVHIYCLHLMPGVVVENLCYKEKRMAEKSLDRDVWTSGLQYSTTTKLHLIILISHFSTVLSSQVKFSPNSQQKLSHDNLPARHTQRCIATIIITAIEILQQLIIVSALVTIIL